MLWRDNEVAEITAVEGQAAYVPFGDEGPRPMLVPVDELEQRITEARLLRDITSAFTAAHPEAISHADTDTRMNDYLRYRLDRLELELVKVSA